MVGGLHPGNDLKRKLEFLHPLHDNHQNSWISLRRSRVQSMHACQRQTYNGKHEGERLLEVKLYKSIYRLLYVFHSLWTRYVSSTLMASLHMSPFLHYFSRILLGCRLGYRPHGVAAGTLCVCPMAFWLWVCQVCDNNNNTTCKDDVGTAPRQQASISEELP